MLNGWISIPFVSGVGAGVVSTLVCNPFDVAKVRLQVQGSQKLHKYQGPFDTLIKIAREEGFRGAFKGLGVALCTIPLFWGIYWQSYDASKKALTKAFPALNSSVNHLISAVGAGALGNLIVNPFWVVKTRLQAQVFDATQENFFVIFKSIYVSEGLRAYYKGLNASLLGLSHVAIQFPVYEHLKTRFRAYRGSKDEGFLDLLCSSIAAKTIASSVTYPHEVIRARLQYSHNPSGSLIGMLTTIYTTEGIRGLYSGFSMNLVRMIPATVTTFLTYEYFSRYLRSIVDAELN